MMNEKIKLTYLERAIYATIAYFDMFSYPLTTIEIWKWLFIKKENQLRKFSLNDVTVALEGSQNLKQLLSIKNGFHFLNGKDEIVQTRWKRHNFTQKRFKRMRKFARLVQMIPFVGGVAACNTIAISDIKKDSDLDVFIIIRRGRMWYTRFKVTALTWLAKMWRHGDKVANRICLSFFITDDAMNLESIAKKPYDIYLMYWISLLVPLWDDGVFKDFSKQNAWIRDYLPNYTPYSSEEMKRLEKNVGLYQGLRKAGEAVLHGGFGNLVEKLFRRLERGKMKDRLGKLDHRNTDVIVSDQMLKFHEVDKRDKFRALFESYLDQIV